MADEIKRKHQGQLFKVSIVSRWNSLQQILEKFKINFHESGDNLGFLMDILELERFKDFKVKFISEYLEVTKSQVPAKNILLVNENYYAGYLLPTISLLKEKKVKLKEDKLSYCLPLVEALCKGIEWRRSAPVFDDRKYF